MQVYILGPVTGHNLKIKNCNHFLSLFHFKWSYGETNLFKIQVFHVDSMQAACNNSKNIPQNVFLKNNNCRLMKRINNGNKCQTMNKLMSTILALTGSPGSLPPRILNPKPVSFLHRKISCSW